MSVEFCNSVSAPESLDVNFFQESLENGLLERVVTVKKVAFEMGSGGGDNYCSQIYRVRLTFQRGSEPLESISVIVKSIAMSDATQFLEDLRVFLKEKIVYFHILPRMEILLDRIKLGPKLYHTAREPINTLVFEDLSPLGYVMADREKGLDMSHCQLVMKKLGHFHGVSMVLQKKDPESMNSFQRGILSEVLLNSSEVFVKVFSKNLNSLVGLVSKWKGYEGIIEKLKAYGADIKQNLIKSQLPIAGELKVLNHGDLWVNNVMFKYAKDKQVDDVIFLDFQMSIYGSPGIDINYFLYTSMQLDVLKESREELLRTYHTALCEKLEAHRYTDIPSFDDILSEVLRREPYGFFANFGVFPAISMDKAQSTDNSIDNFMDEEFSDKKVKIMFSSKRLAETMKYTLKRFDELGIWG